MARPGSARLTLRSPLIAPKLTSVLEPDRLTPVEPPLIAPKLITVPPWLILTAVFEPEIEPAVEPLWPLITSPPAPSVIPPAAEEDTIPWLNTVQLYPGWI